MFLNETGFMLQSVVRRTWAPKGQTPIHHSWDRRDHISVISAITVSSGRHRLRLYFDIHDHNIDTDRFEWFVRWLRHRVRRGIVLVVDWWSVHRSGVRRLLARFGFKVQVESLPSFAPELNPVEQVWSHTKYADLAHYVPDNVHVLAEEVSHSLGRARTDQKLLCWFFRHTGLRI